MSFCSVGLLAKYVLRIYGNQFAQKGSVRRTTLICQYWPIARPFVVVEHATRVKRNHAELRFNCELIETFLQSDGSHVPMIWTVVQDL